MSDAPVQLFVAAFPGEQDADTALKEVQEARKRKVIDVIDVAVLRRDARNKLHVKETADMNTGKGAAIGGAVGAVIGLLFPPSVILTGGFGALVGGLTAKLRDTGFPDAELRELGASLQPGTSAIVALVEHRWITELQRQVEAEGGKIVRQALADDIRAQLEAGRGVTYSALAGEGGAALSRTTADENHIEIEHVLMNEDGVAAVALTADALPEDAATAAPEAAAPEAPKA